MLRVFFPHKFSTIQDARAALLVEQETRREMERQLKKAEATDARVADALRRVTAKADVIAQLEEDGFMVVAQETIFQHPNSETLRDDIACVRAAIAANRLGWDRLRAAAGGGKHRILAELNVQNHHLQAQLDELLTFSSEMEGV